MNKKGGDTDEMLACTLLQESGGAGGDGVKGASGEWQGPWHIELRVKCGMLFDISIITLLFCPLG